jgi:predicted kinase
MNRIIILIGISGSGKSTYAQELMEEYNNSIIVGRDKLRELLFGYTEETVNELYTRPDRKQCEDQVTKVFNTIVHEHLKGDNATVIMDNTHLTDKWLDDIKKEFNYVDEFVYVFLDTRLETAIERDKLRSRKVGEEIITKQYNQLMEMRGRPAVSAFRINDDTIVYSRVEVNTPDLINTDTSGKTNCYIFDIDGTLADKGTRNAYDETKVLSDTVIPEVHKVMTRLGNDYIIFVSGRSEKCYDDTLKWIEDNIGHFPLQEMMLHMRKEGDIRPDWQVKEEIWREISKTYHIDAIFDDRLQVIRRANKLGLFVFNVNQKMINF